MYYNSHKPECKKPFGAVRTGSPVSVYVWTGTDFYENIYLCAYGKRRCEGAGMGYENVSYRIPMNRGYMPDGQGNMQSVFMCELNAPDKAVLLWYHFEYTQNGMVGYYGNDPDGMGGEGRVYDSIANVRDYQLTVYDKDFHVPEWFKGSVMYQIFPDRFFNGNPDGSVVKKDDEYKIYSSWEDDMDVGYGVDDPVVGERRIRNDFYGGNLKGIEAQVDYLMALGVNTIYLNPIFQAYSNHRYDTGDYMKVDPMLGTNEEFKQFTEHMSRCGIRVILDGVFNHTGADSRYFNRYGKYDSLGAYQSKESPYADWYNFRDFDNDRDDYDCWWGIRNVPNVNENAPSYRQFILGEDGVVRYWLDQGIGGWRLDVADELPSEFLTQLRSRAKSADPDAISLLRSMSFEKTPGLLMKLSGSPLK